MKKLVLFLLIAVMLFGCAPAATPSGDASSESGTMEGIDPSFIREIDGVQYYDVKAAGAVGNGVLDDSVYFPENVSAFYIDSGIYALNEPTLCRVLQSDCKGGGMVVWTEYKNMWLREETDQFTGVIPVSKFDDPLYVYMGWPSEAATVMDRIHASNMAAPKEEWEQLLTIGAVYTRSDCEPIPDDKSVTICIGRTTLAISTTESNGWYLASDQPKPDYPNNIYYLPWELEKEIGNFDLPSSYVKEFDDHYEITIPGQVLNGTFKNDDRITGAVLHFWGENIRLPVTGDKVLGMAGSFEIWVKEPEYADRLTVAIGADWRNHDGSNGDQAYSGFNFTISTEPRIVYGHNVGPNAYDTVMDTEKVQELLGLK